MLNPSDFDTLPEIDDLDDDEYGYRTRGLARELIPNEVLAEEWYSRGQRDLETILEQL